MSSSNQKPQLNDVLESYRGTIEHRNNAFHLSDISKHIPHDQSTQNDGIRPYLLQLQPFDYLFRRRIGTWSSPFPNSLPLLPEKRDTNKMIRTIIIVLLYTVIAFASIDGISGATSLRRDNPVQELDRLETHENTRVVKDDDESQIIRGQRPGKQLYSYERQKTNKSLNYPTSRKVSRMVKSDKQSKSKKSERRHSRHDNIFIHNENESLSEENTSTTATGSSNTAVTTMTTMRMTDTMSKPDERNIPTYVPAPIEHPALAPTRLPTRQRNDASPPTRTGVSEPVGKFSGSGTTTITDEPCPDLEAREPIYSQYQNIHQHDNAVDGENEQIAENNEVIIVTDDKEKEVSPVNDNNVESEVGPNQEMVHEEAISEQETDDDEDIIGDFVLDGTNGEVNELNTAGKEENRSESWKYFLLFTGILLFIVIVAFLRKKSTAEEGKDGSSMLGAPIDSTVPLDQSDRYSGAGVFSGTSSGNAGHSRMQSGKSYTELEEVRSPLREPSMDFGLIQSHDSMNQSASINSSPISPLAESSESYESSEETFGNIDNFDDDEDFTDNIDNDNDFEEEYDEDEYLYDYEIEDPDTEEIDDGDIEEGTLSWEEEEYLSTIEEESYGDVYSR